MDDRLVAYGSVGTSVLYAVLGPVAPGGTHSRLTALARVIALSIGGAIAGRYGYRRDPGKGALIGTAAGSTVGSLIQTVEVIRGKRFN